MAKAKQQTKGKDSTAHLGFEAKLWQAGDALRNNIDAQEKLPGRVESSEHGTGRLPSDILLGHEITMPRTLGALHDTLLPRLISGEVPIHDAERIVGNAT